MSGEPRPSPLYRLLVLSLLSSTRNSAAIAVAASRELSGDGLGTVAAMEGAFWQRIVDALGRAHYRRYDESTATALGDGLVGADIFCREARLVWPELRPFFDRASLEQAERLGLPHTPGGLANRVAPDDLARLSAALVRVRLGGGRRQPSELARGGCARWC